MEGSETRGSDEVTPLSDAIGSSPSLSRSWFTLWGSAGSGAHPLALVGSLPPYAVAVDPAAAASASPTRGTGDASSDGSSASDSEALPSRVAARLPTALATLLAEAPHSTGNGS